VHIPTMSLVSRSLLRGTLNCRQPGRRPDAEIIDEEITLERLGGKFLDGGQVLFGEIEWSNTTEEGTGLTEWWGRFWLPEGGRVEPGRTYGLIRDDERAMGRIVENFGPDATGEDVAVFQGNSRLE
jgi:hypothetical protein